jgi:hypothetical protein
LDVLWDLPILHFFAPLFQSPPELLPATSAPETVATAEPPQILETCSVAPLDPIEDQAAKQLEASVGFDAVVDVSEMAPAAARALDLFELHTSRLRFGLFCIHSYE